MYRKRLALGALVVGLAVVVSGALTNSSGQVPQEPAPGVTYGGEKAFDTVWLRLHPSREVIAAIEIPWEVAPDRCKNDGNGYYSTLFAGFQYDFPIDVSPQGKFRKPWSIATATKATAMRSARP